MVGGSSPSPSPSPVLVFAFCAACIFGQLLHLAQAQNETTAVTDPAEGISLSLCLSLLLVIQKEKELQENYIHVKME